MSRSDIRPLIVIFATIALDAVGIGLVIPILPRLLQQVAHTHNISPYMGSMIALYALMQFVFAPILGALSDRIGRRPVLVMSMIGVAIDYMVMAIAPDLWMLFLGRAIAGITSANLSVASAYLTDITPPEKRAGRFGTFNAMFGLGFIIGPILGGVLGDHDLRLPFWVAAGLNGVNLGMALMMLPETRVLKPGPQGQTPRDEAADQGPKTFSLRDLNPFGPLAWAFSLKGLWPVLLVILVMSATGEAYGTCWALWGYDAFHWSGFQVGLSLGAFGICQALTQALLPRLVARHFNERTALLIGILCSSLALIVMATAAKDWMVFAIMPIFAMGGMGTPLLQSLATRKVDENRQGQLQGVLTSAISLAAIGAPLIFSSIYLAVQKTWPGAIWLSVVAIYILAIPLVLISTQNKETHEAKAGSIA